MYKIRAASYIRIGANNLASFTERYHELTKYNPHTIDKLGPVHWDHQPAAFKAISSKVKIDLLSRLQAVMEHLEEGAPVTDSPEAGLENIAKLLFFTLGLTARLGDGGASGDQGGGDYFLRAAPSAGGLYPTEMYVAARNQSGLPDGLYHYHSLKSALIPVWQGAFWGDLKHYFLGHPAVDASGLILIFTGMYARSAWRYKERAYRRILLDSGHAVGNLLEVCRYSGLDHSLMGGFLDAGLEELLFLTRKEEFPLLGVAIGPAGTLPAVSGQHPGETPPRPSGIWPRRPGMRASRTRASGMPCRCSRTRANASVRKKPCGPRWKGFAAGPLSPCPRISTPSRPS